MIKKISPFIIVIFFVLIGFFLIYSSKITQNPSGIKYVQIAGQNIKVELALTAMDQQKGLGGRNALEVDEGMLFVFNKIGKYPFWMKEMNFPIDIIWFNENMKVIYIKKDANPESYPATFMPDQYAKYVLEVFSGFSDKNNLQIGDNMLFTY